jgi:hypothetical protein
LAQRTPLGKAIDIAIINGDSYERIAQDVEVKVRTLKSWRTGYRKPPISKAIKLTRRLGYSFVEELFPLTITTPRAEEG